MYFFEGRYYKQIILIFKIIVKVRISKFLKEFIYWEKLISFIQNNLITICIGNHILPELFFMVEFIHLKLFFMCDKDRTIKGLEELQ